MSRDKQIEEMTKAIDQAKYDMWVGKAHQSGDFTNHSKNIATALYNEGYCKQTEWISVEDRLPDKDGEYLTWSGLIYYLIWFNASLGLWNVSEDGDTSTAIRNVTHWMPLPEAPKGGE